MASPSRRSSPDLTAELLADPSAFEFVQAVRLLEDALGASAAARRDLGGDEIPSDESVRLRAAPSLAFPSAPVASIRAGKDGQYELEVSFLGLTGPAGVLPQHYTELVIERLTKRDPALREFIDLLHHRTLSLFYRACTKYRLHLSHERAWRRRKPGPEPDHEPFAHVLACVAGRGIAKSRADSLADLMWRSNAGSFARGSRNVSDLQRILTDFLGMPVQIRQFVGRWLEVPEEARSRLPRRGEAPSPAGQLGRGLSLGSRFWDVSSRIRVELGPMPPERFLELLPEEPLMEELRRVIDAFCDGRMDIEVALTLAPDARLDVQLSPDGAVRPRLGWTTRLSARKPEFAQSTVLFSLPSG